MKKSLNYLIATTFAASLLLPSQLCAQQTLAQKGESITLKESSKGIEYTLNGKYQCPLKIELIKINGLGELNVEYGRDGLMTKVTQNKIKKSREEIPESIQVFYDNLIYNIKGVCSSEYRL